MSHGIEERDGVFSVRQPMWHGMGEVLGDYPTREQAQAKVHPWEPIPEPVYRKVLRPTGKYEQMVASYEPIPDAVLNVRSDDKVPIGLVSESRVTVTNNELWDIAEAIEGGPASDVRFETAGSLFGGKKVWILLRLNEPIEIKGDPNGKVLPYYGLQNGHTFDGGSLRGQGLMDRIVCNNTSMAADYDARLRGTEFTFRHTRNIHEKIEQAQAALAGWRAGVQEWAMLNAHLTTLPVTKVQRERFITEFVPMPPPHTVSDRVVSNVESARTIIRDILAGPTCEGINGTVYGLVQASVEYLNHYQRARTRETRFKRAYLDRNTVVADALRIAQAVAS